MNTVATNIQIRNFKSIKDLQFEAKKVNIFIGRPNVGKSNILEALSLLGAGHSNNPATSFFKDLVRYIKPVNLFYDEDFSKKVEIIASEYKSQIEYFEHTEELCFSYGNGSWFLESSNISSPDNEFYFQQIWSAFTNLPEKEKLHYKIPMFSRGTLESFGSFQNAPNLLSPFKKYQFDHNVNYSQRFKGFLKPSNGSNLYEVLDKNDALFDEINLIFNSYNLSLELYPQDRTFEIIKRTGKKAYKYPYNHASDTLQRLIFYFAAIDSNTNSAIILEEPEVHSFPPYTASLAERIAADPSNQYFIATHSPYLLESLINKSATDDIAVFLTYYENWETKVQRIPNDLIADYLNSDFDLFFNLLQIQETLQ